VVTLRRLTQVLQIRFVVREKSRFQISGCGIEALELLPGGVVLQAVADSVQTFGALGMTGLGVRVMVVLQKEGGEHQLRVTGLGELK